MFMPTCHEVQSELTEYTEGTLPVSRKLGIWMHLLFCRSCAGFLRGLRALSKLGKTALAPPSDPPADAVGALARIQAKLRERS
jgi:hypothetical protein